MKPELKVEDLTPEELSRIAAEPRQPTRQQLMEIEVTRVCEAWLDKHDDFPRTVANLEMLIGVLKQHSLDPRVEENFTLAFTLLNDAQLLETAAPAAPAAHKWTQREVDALTSAEYKQHYYQTVGFKEAVDAFDEPNKTFGNPQHAHQQFK